MIYPSFAAAEPAVQVAGGGGGGQWGTLAVVLILVVLSVGAWWWGRYRQRVGATRARAEVARETALKVAEAQAMAEARAPSGTPQERLDALNEEVGRLARGYGVRGSGPGKPGGKG